MLEALKLVVQLIQAVIWPAFAVFLVLVFHRPLKAYVEKLGQASVKLPGGFELSLSQVAASAAAAGAAVGKQAASEDQPVPEDAYRKIAAVFAEPATLKQGTLNQRSILWVDDTPQGNVGLANAFRALGVRVVTATSTAEAERALADTFDLIITDMSRRPDPEAGKTLVALLHQRGITTPVIIYAARWAAQHRQEAASLGVRAITNDPGEVYSVAMTVLQSE